MAYFALLWKARAVEKYRLKYETEKINSMTMAGIEVPRKTLFQKWRTYKYDTQKRISRRFSEWYPEGSAVSNLLILLKTDQSFPNFLLKSVIGFVGGIVLTYICFMFFVFQLSISLVHATIMSSIIGVLLTLGLAFSYRIRCLVFLLIPQFFSRVGRYTLTCYALVLILTGPATNTLKNSEVLSESMACSQEQIKTNAQQLNESIKRPMNLMKESIKPIMERFNEIANKMKWSAVKINRLTMSIVSVIESNFFYLKSLTRKCNDNLGTPYKRCMSALKEGVQDCMETFGRSWLNDAPHVANAACDVTLSYKRFCPVIQYIEEDVIADVKKKIKTFSEHLASLLNIEVNIHHWYTFSSNTSRSTSQVTAGIVTEIRKRADPLLTWLSWSSCVTSLSLLLIIFRAKYYQHMYETRSRFDNRYITQELRDLDMKRLREGRETVLPLNRRERAKYITTTSFSLVASERRYMSRSAVFMAITTFKLLIHMVADYSLYWVLMTIRYHGIFQSPLQAGVSNTGAHITGSGFVTNLLKSIVETLNIPLEILTPSPISCLPNPNPPDFRRYTQIGVLIFLLWFFALFEPYGLRLRHLIMGHYRPERAKARAVWLNNHILRTRGSFMKLARRKLHKEYKYTSESKYTFKRWLDSHIPFQCLRTLLGTGPVEPHCLLCGENSKHFDQNSDLTRCKTRDCPGIYCAKCFSDIGQLCTICMSPSDYGDLSDVDLEKGSSDESDDEDKDPGNTSTKFLYRYQHSNEDENFETTRKPKKYITRFFSKNSSTDKIPLLPLTSHNMNEIISENLQKYDYTENHNILNIISKLKNAFNLMHIRKEELSLEKSDILYRIHDENSFKYIIQNMKSIYFDNLLSKYVIHDTEAYRTDKYVYNSNKELNSHTKFIESIRSSQNKNFHMKSEFNEFLISKYLEVTEILLKCTVYEIMKKNKSVIVTKLKRNTELSKRLKRKFSLLRRRKKTQKLHVSKLKNVARYYRKIPREKIVKQNVPSFNKELPKTAKRNLKDTRKNDKNSKRSSSKRNEDNCKKERKYKKANKNSRQDKSKTNKRRKGDFRIPTDDKKTNKISMKCSRYWNNLKCNLIPCIDFINISNQQVVTTKKLNNFKRRKKNNNESEYQIDKNLENREDMRNFKLSTYLYDRYWANIKHNNDIENNGNYLSHTLKNSDKQEKEMSCETTDAKGLTNEVMKSDTVPLNTFVEPIETDENDTVKCLYKKRNVGCIPAYISLHERALNRFRRKVNRLETKTSPIVSLTRKICEDKGCCVRSKVKTNFKNQNENKTVKCYCRLPQKKAVSCACKENDEPTEKTEDAKPTDHVPDEDLNKKGEIIEKCGIAKVLNDIEDEKDDSKTKFNVNKKRSEKYTAPFFERLQNSYSTIRKFYATLFTELFEKNNVCKTCMCQTAAASQPKVEKATAVKPRTRSCGCQCLPKMQEKTTQLSRPLVEVSQCVSEKFTIDAEVDASNRQHTCTCAAQQRILSRDVGTLRKSLLQSTSSVGDKSSINTNTNSLSMDSLQSISSIYSDGTKTDTTVCSLATTDYHGEITHNSRGDNDGTRNKRTDYKLEKHLTKLEYNERALHRTRKHRIKVVTKANQSTLTDRTKLCDVSTITNDWWSPIVERKDMKIVKRQRCHAEKREKKYMKNTGVGPDEKIVTFRSRAQIIPPGKIDILSPSRYLLESQRYYNELFAYNLHTPQLLSLSQHQKQVTEKNRSLSVRHHSRRGTTHKNKRLEQCYSPRKQASSRKWDMEFIMSPEAAKYRKASYPMIN